MKEIKTLIPIRKPGVEEFDICKIEELLQALFPTKYRELIKLVNQAEIGEWILFPIKDSQRVQKTFDDIVRNNKETGLPDGYIAFAEDGTGDLLCYRVIDGVMDESIYLWNHEEENFEELYKDIEQMILALQ